MCKRNQSFLDVSAPSSVWIRTDAHRMPVELLLKCTICSESVGISCSHGLLVHNNLPCSYADWTGGPIVLWSSSFPGAPLLTNLYPYFVYCGIPAGQHGEGRCQQAGVHVPLRRHCHGQAITNGRSRCSVAWRFRHTRKGTWGCTPTVLPSHSPNLTTPKCQGWTKVNADAASAPGRSSVFFCFLINSCDFG